jgi:hypothetical protein
MGSSGGFGLEDRTPGSRLEVAYADPEIESLARRLKDRLPLGSGAPHGTQKVLRTAKSGLITVVSEEDLKETAVVECAPAGISRPLDRNLPGRVTSSHDALVDESHDARSHCPGEEGNGD